MQLTLSAQASPDIAPEGVFNTLAGRILEGEGEAVACMCQIIRMMVEYWHQEVHMGNTGLYQPMGRERREILWAS